MHRISTSCAAAALCASLAACASSTEAEAGPAILLVEDFNEENNGSYQLNYAGFEQWIVTGGTVDLIGTAPFDDFLPAEQGLYVDLDGTTRAAGTLETRTVFDLPSGRYTLQFSLAGTPRPGQPDNTVTVSLGDVFSETFTLESYSPLETYTRTINVSSDTEGRLRFEHQGGDDYGIMVDDIRLRRR